MDLVLLVIAADEGIMPQTREHMDILHLLGIEKSIIVLNKCDIVDEEWLELVEEEVREELKGTFLEKAPVCKVSAATGQGLEELIQVIERMTSDEVVAKDVNTIPRLPIDRAFTLSGFGTIITGTLVSGTIRKRRYSGNVSDWQRVQDSQHSGTWSGIKKSVMRDNVWQLICLMLKKKEIQRGCVLAPPASIEKYKTCWM